VTIPPEYAGREQTLLKHRVLLEYIQGWAHKRGSRAKFGRTKLWYVDCFAGPWNASAADLRDTSVSIGLETLREAAATWEEKSLHVELAAIFVEKNPKSFEALRTYLDEHHEGIEVVALPGEFGEHVSDINRRIGRDPAFLFVDPTGWKGAAMRYIEPLASIEGRDVLVNVMFNHINRFKDDPRSFLREQIGDFFGLEPGAIQAGLSEDALFDLYREQLRDKCRLPFVADLAIPHPTQDRTWFRLVVGGHHSAIVDLFRQVERRVCGEAAGAIRDEAKHRGEQQLSLGVIAAAPDQSYQRLHLDGLREAPADVVRLLTECSPRLYSDLWPHVLADRHIGKPDLNKIVWELHKKKVLAIRGLTGRQHTPHDDSRIELASKRGRRDK
jgi:three-Cys-motif partner protein